MKKTILVLTLALVWTSGAQAAITTIDFEAYTDAQNLHGVNLGGVTLYEPQNQVVEVYDNRFGVSYKSATKAVSSNTSSVAALPLTGVFDAVVDYVSIWAGDAGNDTDQWELEVFSDAGATVSLGVVTSAQWNGNPYTQLSISATGIQSFQVRYLDPVGLGAGIGYDDLQFNTAVIPAPGAVVLGAIGTGLVGWLRRRRSL